MAATAAVLGSLQGLWLELAGRSSEARSVDLPWLGSVSGGVLGLLGFPPVFSRSSIVPDPVMVADFVMADILGGAAAGFAWSLVAAAARQDRRVNFGRGGVVGGFVGLLSA